MRNYEITSPVEVAQQAAEWALQKPTLRQSIPDGEKPAAHNAIAAAVEKAIRAGARIGGPKLRPCQIHYYPERTKAEVHDEKPRKNRERIAHATAALTTYAAAVGALTEPLDQTLGDFFCDLAHFCDSKGLSLKACMDLAQSNYDAETRGRGKQL